MSFLNPLSASCHAPVASCVPFEDTDAESQANASLIAAAPELWTGLERGLQQTVDMDLAYGIELIAVRDVDLSSFWSRSVAGLVRLLRFATGIVRQSSCEPRDKKIMGDNTNWRESPSRLAS